MLFGQDWTLFGSSTLPNMLETTGLGVAFGSLYERDPQMRVGYTHRIDGLSIEPEFSFNLPASGIPPSAPITVAEPARVWRTPRAGLQPSRVSGTLGFPMAIGPRPRCCHRLRSSSADLTAGVTPMSCHPTGRRCRCLPGVSFFPRWRKRRQQTGRMGRRVAAAHTLVYA